MPRYGGSGLGASFYIAKRTLRQLQSSQVVKTQTVPGGSTWMCVNCESNIPAGFQVAKVGKKIFCTSCIQKEKAEELREYYDRREERERFLKE